MKKNQMHVTKVYITDSGTPCRFFKQPYGDYLENFRWMSFDVCDAGEVTDKNTIKELNRLHRNMKRRQAK